MLKHAPPAAREGSVLTRKFGRIARGPCAALRSLKQNPPLNYDWQTKRPADQYVYPNPSPVPDRAAQLQRTFGAIVRAERLARQLTQQQLAFEAGLSLTYVGEIERGQRMVSLDTIMRMATALKLTGAELLGRAQL